MITNCTQNEAAKEIGQILSKISNLEELECVDALGAIRLNKTKDISVPLIYRNKKNVFSMMNGGEVVIIHFSGEEYGHDPKYFRECHEKSKNIYGWGKFERRKVLPKLFGFDDTTMTLIVEKGKRDLSDYFDEKDPKKVEGVCDRIVNVLKYVWENTEYYNRHSVKWPRYVENFLKPEYRFLEGEKIKYYLSPALTKEYKDTQKRVEEFVSQIPQFYRGWGNGDMSLNNLVEDEEGNILFVDVEKCEDDKYHWMTQIGQILGSKLKECNDIDLDHCFWLALAVRIEKEMKCDKKVKNLISLGIMNQLLIGATFRNIAFESETKGRVNEKNIEQILSDTNFVLDNT